MKSFAFLILIFNILILPPVLMAQESFEFEDISSIANDFNLSCELLDKYGAPIKDKQNTLRGIVTVRILSENQSPEKKHTLRLYLDKGYVARKDSISLPYNFKWNFKGLYNGKHELIFVLKDSEGRAGVLNLEVNVRN